MGKKIGMVAVLLLVFPLVGLAQQSGTATGSIAALIAQLQAQIQALQSQLTALHQAQTNVGQAVSDVNSTVRLIRNLREGMSGDDVKALQAVLSQDMSVYPEGLITGYFGKATARAVKKYQEKNGLPGVGNVGPLTLGKLNKELDNQPLALEDSNGTKIPCAIVPPGHLIAPGYLRKNNGVTPVVPACQTLPPGILAKLNGYTTGTSSTSSVDTVPPVISGISSTASSDNASVSWLTNEPATSQVQYGTSSLLGTFTPLNLVLATSHTQAITGLATGTVYYFSVWSKDAALNTATSSVNSFTTTQ